MRIVYMGTPEFAKSILELLIKSNHEVIAVLTQPDKPQGRKKILTPPPVKVLAQSHKIPVYQPEKLSIQKDNIKSFKPDCIVVAAYGKILPSEILEIPRLGCINVHASLLPKYRGAAPIQRAIIEGETKTGITTMYMDEGLDTGDICLQEEVHIEKNETSGELFEKMAIVGGNLLLKTLDKMEKDEAPRIKQDDKKSSYASILTKAEGEIDFNKPAIEIHNLIRGMNPWPVAYTYFEGKKLKIFSSNVIKRKAEPGMILDDKSLVIGCKEDSLQLETLQIEGGKRMQSRDFLNGRKIPKEMILKKEN